MSLPNDAEFQEPGPHSLAEGAALEVPGGESAAAAAPESEVDNDRRRLSLVELLGLVLLVCLGIGLLRYMWFRYDLLMSLLVGGALAVPLTVIAIILWLCPPRRDENPLP